MSQETQRPGATVGSYEVLEEVGRGALGIVYRCRHVHLGRIAAVKVLRPYWTASEEFVARFREEGRVMAMLEHPNILRVYDAGEAGGHFYLAMAYLEGPTLQDRLASPISIEEGVRIASQLAAALAYAHERGVIHRDVKPANIVLAEPGANAVLMDFGFARLRDSQGLTMPGVRVGTPFYMAPEQILGEPVDGRTDIYALGVVLYQMIAGRLPFPGPETELVYAGHLHEPPPSLREECPEWVRRIVERAIAKSPDDRFQSADTVQMALESAGDPRVLGRAGIRLSETPVDLRRPSGRGDWVHETSILLARCQRTALSLDVVGSRRMKRPGMTMLLSQQFARFRSYVRSHLQANECVTSTWAGDGLLALFESPDRAVTCAVGIQCGLQEFNAERDDDAPPIRVRIGVHAGEVLMSENQPLGEVTSVTLDIAGHLQKKSPPNGILISDSAREALDEPVDWDRTEMDDQFDVPIYRYSPGRAAARDEASGDQKLRPGDDVPPAASSLPDVLRLRLVVGETTSDHLVETETVIGRAGAATSRVPYLSVPGDYTVSRRHARIYAGGGGFYLEDLGSTNGTRLNGHWLRPSSPVLLKSGDAIQVGESSLLRVVAIGPASAERAVTGSTPSA
jgi:class 3 adenylate cyclase